MTILIVFLPLNRGSMPNTNSSDIRYNVLDRCIRRGGYSTTELISDIYLSDEIIRFHNSSPKNQVQQRFNHTI